MKCQAAAVKKAGRTSVWIIPIRTGYHQLRITEWQARKLGSTDGLHRIVSTSRTVPQPNA
jgi:hypothetical protein